MDFPKQLKKTKQRIELLKILEEQDTPLTASELYNIASGNGCKMNFSTIYRTLTAFCKAGILNEYSATVTDEASYELKREKHRHYAICLRCHKKIPIENCPITEHIAELDKEGFKITDHRVELFGYCKECQNSGLE